MALNASKRGFIKKECYMVMDWEMIKGWMITGKGRLVEQQCHTLALNVCH